MTTLEHIGIAVEDPDAVASLLRDLLGLQTYKTEAVEREGVKTHFLGAGATKLELLESTAPDSPVARFLEKRGEGVHHLAFEVEDAGAVLTRARRMGLRPLSAQAQPGADRKRIAFFHPGDTHGLLIEVCESAGLDDEAEERESVVAFGTPRSPAVALLCGPDVSQRGLWRRVAEFLESRFYTVLAEAPKAAITADSELDRLLRDVARVSVFATPGQLTHAESFADRRGSASVAVCDAREGSPVAVRTLRDGIEYRIPPVTGASRESVRLLADLLAQLAAAVR